MQNRFPWAGHGKRIDGPELSGIAEWIAWGNAGEIARSQRRDDDDQDSKYDTAKGKTAQLGATTCRWRHHWQQQDE